MTLKPLSAKRNVRAIDTACARGHRSPGISTLCVAGYGCIAGGLVAGNDIETPENGSGQLGREKQRDASVNEHILLNAAKRRYGYGYAEQRTRRLQMAPCGSRNVLQPLRDF